MFDRCQDRDGSKQREDSVTVELMMFCCSPVTRRPLSADEAAELARVFKGDPVRLRLLRLIAAHAGGEACVCDLTGAFDLSGPTISHHLKVLRKAGLIEGERRATWIYYRVRPQLLRQLSDVLVPDPAGVLA